MARFGPSPPLPALFLYIKKRALAGPNISGPKPEVRSVPPFLVFDFGYEAEKERCRNKRFGCN